MQKKQSNSTSPYYQPESSVTLFKMRLVQHLELMRMPTVAGQHDPECSRECHLMERNHTIEAIKHFVTNIPSVDN